MLRDSVRQLSSLQFIDADGNKRFLSGGRVTGCYHAIGTPNGSICIAEGHATGASIYQATGREVAVAFDCGNLESVARAIRAKCPDTQIVAKRSRCAPLRRPRPDYGPYLQVPCDKNGRCRMHGGRLVGSQRTGATRGVPRLTDERFE